MIPRVSREENDERSATSHPHVLHRSRRTARTSPQPRGGAGEGVSWQEGDGSCASTHGLGWPSICLAVSIARYTDKHTSLAGRHHINVVSRLVPCETLLPAPSQPIGWSAEVSRFALGNFSA